MYFISIIYILLYLLFMCKIYIYERKYKNFSVNFLNGKVNFIYNFFKEFPLVNFHRTSFLSG